LKKQSLLACTGSVASILPHHTSAQDTDSLVRRGVKLQTLATQRRLAFDNFIGRNLLLAANKH